METTIHLRFAGARSAFRLPNGVKKTVGAKIAFVHPKIHRKSQTRGFQCDDCDGHMFYIQFETETQVVILLQCVKSIRFLQ